jgi:hypothetical protein
MYALPVDDDVVAAKETNKNKRKKPINNKSMKKKPKHFTSDDHDRDGDVSEHIPVPKRHSDHKDVQPRSDR